MRKLVLIMAATASLIAGVITAVFSLSALLRYSPYGDPGDLQHGIDLGLAALVLVGWPVVYVAMKVVAGLWREYRAWARTLTPQQRNYLALAEAAAAVAAHEAWADHNSKVSARLTQSVMGPEREDPSW